MVGHTNWVRSATFSPDARLISTGGDDKNVIVWNSETKAEITRFNDHAGVVFHSAFHPDGTTLASCSEDKKVKVINIKAILNAPNK